MTQLRVEVVEVGAIEKHPNADSLGIVKVYGFPVITRLGEFQPGDRAAYIPVDALVPDTEQWAFLQGHRRIRAKKLRGTFSMGLLVPAPEGVEVGQDVSEALGIRKYEPQDKPDLPSDAEEGPAFIPKYTEIDHFRRYHQRFTEGEPIVVTEKIHGCNARFCHDGDRLWVGSFGTFKAPGTNNEWRKVAAALGLEAVLAYFPGLVFYGEVFGWVQDLRYGHAQGQFSARFFDVYDSSAGSYLNYTDAQAVLKGARLEPVPTLYEGPYQGPEQIASLAGGKSTLADNIREGVVVRPARERFDDHIGRVVLKFVSEGYLLRKNGTEAR